jgi:hypothetical protein
VLNVDVRWREVSGQMVVAKPPQFNNPNHFKV